MATATVRRYTLDQFEDIICNGISYALPPQVIASIQEIAEKVGAPEYIRTPQFVRKHGSRETSRGGSGGRRRGRRKAQEVSDEDWEAIRQFEATQQAKREGIDASIDIIRKALNKITDKTYDNLFPQLIEEMDKVIEACECVDTGEEDKNKLSERIFTIVSETAFYSDMYAKLYYELATRYEWLRPVFQASFDTYLDSTKNINYVSPDDDYDGFCKNNKENARRQSIGKFFVNISKYRELIDANSVSEMIEEIQEYMISLIDDDDIQYEIVDELSEITAGMIIAGHENILTETDSWNNILENVKSIAGMKSKEHTALSNKAVFKHMDVMDVVV